MAEFIYQIERARKAHGDKVILDDVTLAFYPGAKIGVVGPNGMGKSTLLKIMAGLEEVSLGEARLTPGYTVGLLQQEPPLDEDKTVIENVRMAFGDIVAKVERFNAIGMEMAEPDADFDALMAEMGELQDAIDAADGWDVDSKLRVAMDALQCPPEDTPVSILSGGERRRVALCRLLLEAPDLLLLDEPTNHLDAESVLWLEQFLKNYPGAVLAVTHDRYFLDNVAEWICEVDRGHLYPYKGNYSTYLETKASRIKAQGEREARLLKRIEAELDWVRSSPKARQAKNKARLERYEQMEAEARAYKKVDFTDIHIPVGPRLGNVVLEAEHLHKEFDGRVLIDDLSFSLPRNGIVGIIGPNGVGKSTLLKCVVGLEELSGGSLKVGETVKISYVDQNRAGIDPDKKLWELVGDGLEHIMVGETEVPVRAYIAGFGFKGSDQQKPAGVLSGGERNRLNLALTLKQGGNLLLLDEPTNDLDTETLESLEAALLEFPGCSVVVSHDRWFLDRIATHILAWEGTDEDPGNWHWFEGNFEAYQKDRVERLGIEGSKPRSLHRKLTR
ncbi:MAG: energy-dependent translational throttle protein EttA [Coriobacteriales bacterium]